MDPPKLPKATANDLLAKVIKPVFGGTYPLPIPLVEFITDYTRQRFPSDPITEIKGADLPGFEGMLRPNKTRIRWQILYNDSADTSPGRIRFTQAHEFGHYLLHRQKRDAFSCRDSDMVEWDAAEAGIEKEADEFAATFLMPTDDLRQQVSGQPPSFDLLSHCADRYEVSLMAAMLKWVEFAPRRAAEPPTSYVASSEEQELLDGYRRADAGLKRSLLLLARDAIKRSATLCKDKA